MRRFKFGDVVTVVKPEGGWPFGFTGVILERDPMTTVDCLVQFTDEDAKGRGHSGNTGNPIHNCWWVASDFLRSIEDDQLERIEREFSK
jgi:hypothetical protein